MTLTQFAKQMLPFFADGRLKPIIDRCFELGEVAQAHRYMESSSNFGKIVLKISCRNVVLNTKPLMFGAD